MPSDATKSGDKVQTKNIGEGSVPPGAVSLPPYESDIAINASRIDYHRQERRR